MKSKVFFALFLLSIVCTNIVYAFPVFLKDALGYRVVFKHTPLRVISLAPSITETIYAVGAQKRLIGVTDYDNYPPSVKEKKSVGGVWNPNKELILYLKPDLVMGLFDVHRKLFDYLRKFGIKLFSVNPYVSLKNVYREIEDVSTIMGKEDIGKALVRNMKRKIFNIENDSKRFPLKPKVFFIMWDNPLETVGKPSLITKLIRIAGGISVTRNIPMPFPLYSRARLVVDNPDIIIFAGGSGGMGLCKKRIVDILKGFEINAVRNGDIYELDADILFRAGPRTVIAVEEMHRIFEKWCLRRCSD